MPTTINASASSGLITTADTSTILQLQTGGTTALAVSAAQVVTLTNPLPVASGGSGGTTSTGTGANVLGTTPSFTSTIGVGGATPSASGAGITFPATQSASTDANTLDDYEEGTFTPAFSRSGINVAYTSRNGFYTRVGRVVTLSCDLQLGAITAQGSGVLFLGALPFTGVVGQYCNVGVVNYNTVFDTVVVRTCWIYTNALAFNINTNNTSEYSGNVVANGYLSLTISYTLS